ncbi:MAG: glycosyltransferase family 4 protein [Acidobacteriota bacterium]
MTRIALLCSEPLRHRMAGIGIRYLEIARRLPALAGVEVVVVTPGEPEEVPSLPEGASVRPFRRGSLAADLADCDAAVSQGQLANDLVLECPQLPVAIDLYDPWLVENLHYVESLGLDPYRNDHATWVLQLSRGDFFLCSCEEQRLFYLGWLNALGRVHPHNLAQDPDLAELIATVPFGVPPQIEAHRPLLPPSERKRLLFGGLYDWYDPFTLLEAGARLRREGRGDFEVLFIRNPNPGSTPQRLLEAVEAFRRREGDWIQLLDWTPAERRYDLLRDVDALVAPHRPSLETRLSLRTRFLDALAAGCPAVTSEGGAMSRMLLSHGAGWVAPPGDSAALAGILTEVLDDSAAVESRRSAGYRLLDSFRWETVLQPLVRFCRDPKRDDSKESFAFRPATQAPPDRLSFRIRRRLRRQLEALWPKRG